MLFSFFFFLCLGIDATQAFEKANHSEDAKRLLQTFFIGNYCDVSVTETFNNTSCFQMISFIHYFCFTFHVARA